MLKFFSEMLAVGFGTVAGIALAPIAIALGVSESMIKTAIEAGCRTQDEIKDFLGL